jgi:ABC-type transporter Mla maintaining outer membrane lipid asymmetry ATPase subunit MlaF
MEQRHETQISLSKSNASQTNPAILDEPTSGLDPIASAALREDLTDLAAKDKRDNFSDNPQPFRSGKPL